MFSWTKPFVKFLCRCWASLPRSWVRAAGILLGILWFDIFRFRRKIILNNLAIAFPQMSLAERTRIGRQSVYRMTANLGEFFTLPSVDSRWVARHAVVEGAEHLEKAAAQGKGVYLLSLHMGGYDIAASLIAMKGYDVSLISKFFKNRFMNDLWFGIRGAKGMQFIEPHGSKTAFEILKALKRQGLVIFVLDQFMGKPYGLETEFFGRKTGTAYGLSLFVLKTGSPVVPVYSVEGADGKMHLVFEPAVELESLRTLEKDVAMLRMTQKFNDVLEGIIRRHPEEWLWLHRRWKEFE